MKFSFKIYSVVFLLVYACLFSQIPVRKRAEPLKKDLRKKLPPSPKISSRDSIQEEVYDAVSDYYSWDETNTDPKYDNILALRKKMNESKGLRKTLYQYYLASIYASYVKAYSVRIRKKDVTSLKDLPEDYKTWALNDFYREADRLYSLVMSDQENLKNEKTEYWGKLVDDVDFTKYKPTLYDLVATSYLSFLNELPFDYDTTAKQKIARIENELMQFHLNDADKTALIYLKSNRIEGNVKKQAEELEALAEAFPKDPFSAYLLFQAADLIRKDRSEESFSKAHQLCEKAVGYIPASDWNMHCKKLLNELDVKILFTRIPERNLPGEYLPLKVIHKNIGEIKIELSKLSGKPDFDKALSWRTYSVTEKVVENSNEELDDQSFRTEIFSFKKYNDYRRRQTTLAIPPLEEGLYTMEITSDHDTASEDFVVSDLLYVKRFEDDKKVTFQALNSKTGKSLINEDYVMYQNINDYKDKSYEKDENKILNTGKGTTDQSGMFSLPKSKGRNYNNSIVYFPKLKKYLAIDDSYDEINEDKDREEEEEPVVQKEGIVFTDRAIYRPGQKVFYKGILAQEYYEKTKILPKQKVLVRLINTNDEEVSKTELVTNEFGSVTGTFILPSGGATGSYSIEMTADLGVIPGKKEHEKIRKVKSIKVEEYKRPKFRVIIDPVKEAYILGDNVKVSGKAEAFSGADISGAALTYEVKRKRLYFWRYYDDEDYDDFNSNDEILVAEGKATTDRNGNFNISFNADADPKTRKNRRSYQYVVTAYVTDINGESQNSQSVINIGDLKATINIESPKTILQKEWKSLQVSVSNLNNQKITAKGSLTVSRLKEENKILIPKLMDKPIYGGRNRPDKIDRILRYQYYDKEIFDAYFPYISYKVENGPDKFEKEEIVFTGSFDTGTTEHIELNKTPKAGKYLIEAESFVGSDTVKTFKVIEVLDNISLRTGEPVYFKAIADKKSYRVGEKATVTFYSDFAEGYVNYRMVRNKKEEEYRQIAMKNGKAEVSFIITDTDLKKKVYLNYDFIHENDFESTLMEFNITEKSDRNFDITTQVFRDKIQPGAPEKWILTIKGKDKDKINAEVLASMYDASLDQFVKNQYYFSHYVPYDYDRYYERDDYGSSTYDFLRKLSSFADLELSKMRENYPLEYDEDFPVPKVPFFGHADIKIRKESSDGGAYYYSGRKDSTRIEEVVVVGALSRKKTEEQNSPVYIVDGKLTDKNIADDEIAEIKKLDPDEAVELYGEKASGGAWIVTSKKAMKESLIKEVKARTNLDETAFFFPNLYTDAEGNIKLEFTSPEALTQWKLILFAHTKDLKTGSAEFFTRTQKELMVTPNPPRFLRQGDKVRLSAKIDNLSDKDSSGDIMLYLFNPETSKPLDSAFMNVNTLKKINIPSKGATEASWDIKIPYAVDQVSYKILAKTMNFSDGEENILPILSDRILVTDTTPIFIKEGQTKTYTTNSLLNNTSTSAANFNLSVELTTNPMWFAVMSIPYLRTFPYECSEQLFSRLYGNMLSTYIMNSSPKIKSIFDEWNAKETALNPLETNEKLKTILIEETPWLSSIKDQKEQMKQLALFFNLNKMQRDLKKAQRDLVDRQNPDGSFSWFPGGNKDKTISGHILAGFGKLNKMLKGKTDDYFTNEMDRVIKNTIDYLDKEYADMLLASRKKNTAPDVSDYSSYFYYRSYWTHKKEIPSDLKKVLNVLANTYARDFDSYSMYYQAMIATFLQRYGYTDLAKKCIASLKKSSKTSEDNGVYWQNNTSGWYWYQAPVETQAMLIEAFAEVTPEDVNSIEEMKVWLLKNKQTESWETTRSTTEAVYALLNYGKSWLDAEKGMTMKLGNEVIYPEKEISKTSDAGFFKKSYYWKDITPEKGKMEIQKNSPGVAWGGMYHLYYENMDKVMAHNSSDVAIEKKLFLKTFEGKEPKLQEINSENPIRLGDLVVVRLVIKTNQNMEYIHLKDMRASGFEPVNVLSSYKWQNGAGYYESTKDAATHFFFSYLPKGTYVFEYELKANNAGEFSNGITSFQNMYAPAMSAHSEGTRVKIVK